MLPIALGIAGSIGGSLLGELVEKLITGEYNPEKDRAVLKQERQKRIYEKMGAEGIDLGAASAAVDQEIESHIAEKKAGHGSTGAGALIGGIAGGLAGGAGGAIAKGASKMFGKKAGGEVAEGASSSIANMGAKTDITGMGAKTDIAGMGAKTDITGMGAKSDIAGMGARSDISGMGRASAMPHGGWGRKPPEAQSIREVTAEVVDRPLGRERGFRLMPNEPLRLTGNSMDEEEVIRQAAIKMLRQAGYGGD